MAAGINAVMLILSTGLENSNFQMVSRWLVGSLWGTDWHHFEVTLIILNCTGFILALLFKEN